MRPDMGKIAVDAKRFGDHFGRVSSRAQKHRAQDDERPNKVSMSRARFGNMHPGENLAPLYRWLGKQVDRRWDDVYSEINVTLKGGYTNLEHIKSHVLQRVNRGQIKYIDGWPHAWFQYSWRTESPWRALARDEYFVDDEGVLRRPPQKLSPDEKVQKEAKKRPAIIMLDPLTAASKIDGVWFKSNLKKVPTYQADVIDYLRCKPYKDPSKIVYKKVTAFVSVRDALKDRLCRRKKDGRWVYPDNSRFRAPYDKENLYAPVIMTMSKKEIKQKIPQEYR